MLATIDRPRTPPATAIKVVYLPTSNTGKACIRPFDPASFPPGYAYSESAERRAAEWMDSLQDRLEVIDNRQDSELDALLHPPKQPTRRSRYDKPVRPAWMVDTPIPSPKKEYRFIPRRNPEFSKTVQRKGRPRTKPVPT